MNLQISSANLAKLAFRRVRFISMGIGLAFLGLLFLAMNAQASDAPAAVVVSAADTHTCVLKPTGNVDCYGSNSYGQAADYLGGDATAISTATWHTCVLKSNGNVDCYGNNGSTESGDYLGGDATAVSAFYLHTCVLKLTGDVDCYGHNENGQSGDYLGGDATAVSAGWMHTCVLKLTGNVGCYGWNGFGQAADYLGGDATAVSAGGYHTCVLKLTGSVDCYGHNEFGEGGDYSGGDAIAVSAGGYHTCVLKLTGNVDCYGRNDYGQAADYLGGDATAVSAGGLHTCVLQSSGNVDCYGRNDYGQSADYGLPSAPGSLVATPGNGQITLTWQAPSSNGGSAVTSYKVYRGTTSGGETLVTSGGCSSLGNVLTCTDSGLGNGATRYYKVSANNAVGEGPQSSEASATTFNVPSAPQSLTATAGTGQITLNWQAPSSNGGSAVTSYKVYRGTTSGSQTLVTSGGCSSLGNVLTCTDSGLGNGATRYYKVSAVNAIDQGAFSSVASATTFASPTAPQNVVATAGPGVGQITLDWESSLDDGGTPITGFKISRGNSASQPFLTSVGNVHTFTDTGLADGLTRYYKIQATNSIGDSSYSAIVSATTFAKPTAPQNLQAVPAADGNVILAWQAPASTGGTPVVEYQVYRGLTIGSETPYDSVQFRELAYDSFSDDAAHYIDEACPSGSTCYYRISAVNIVGESPLSNRASAPSTEAPDPAIHDQLNGNCVVYNDKNHDNTLDSGETLATVPCTPDLQTKNNPDGSRTIYRDNDHDRSVDSGETVATIPAQPVVSPKTRQNPDGSVTVYNDANGNNQVDSGETVATVPAAPVVDVKTKDQLNGNCVVYNDRDHDNTVDSGETLATVPCVPDLSLRDNPDGSTTVYNDRDHDNTVDSGETIVTTPADADGDGDLMPDALEPTLCYVDNVPYNFDGTCVGDDWSPPTPSGLVADVERLTS